MRIFDIQRDLLRQPESACGRIVPPVWLTLVKLGGAGIP